MKFRNILLVYPKIPSNTYWSFQYALKFIDKKSAMPPLGLITVASFFPEHYNLRLIDMNIEELLNSDIEWADAVFISAMIVQKNSSEEVVGRCCRAGVVTVMGGPYVTTGYSGIKNVNHLIAGEVEDTFLSFLDDLEAGKAKPFYPKPEKPDIKCLPVPRFDLLNIDEYSSMSVQYSRGCPFRCEFCDIWKVYGNRVRLKKSDNFTAEIDSLYNLGWRGSIFVVDDNFIGNRGRLKKELLPALYKWQKEHDFVFRFYTEASIDMAEDDELLAAMRDSGFNEVFIGIETPCEDSLRETGKGHNIKNDMMKSVRKIQNYGMEVMAGFILGFDSDRDEIFDRQIEFIQEAGIAKAMVGMLTALPETELYKRLESEDRIIGDSTGNNTHCFKTNFKTRMDDDVLKEGYRKILSTIYDYNMKNYFRRCEILLGNLGVTKLSVRKVTFYELKIFFKSVLTQPFRRYGFQYLRFLIRIFFKRPSIIPEAVRFGVIGHHFYVMSREVLKVDSFSSSLEHCYKYLRNRVSVYSEAFRGNSSEAASVLADLWKERNKMLSDFGKGMNKIHSDFRKDAAAELERIAEETRKLFIDHIDYLEAAGYKI
ncbi:MAG: B12-binding domain-containing radical SAM protein [Fibrobacterota bacterium]